MILILSDREITPNGSGVNTFEPCIRPQGSSQVLLAMATPDAVTTPLATGMVISVKNGNWNDPATWSSNQVPSAESAVTIRHTVTVNIDATCKTLKAESPALVQVAAGKKLTVLQ